MLKINKLNEKKLYRKNVGICLINKENKIFAGKRINSKENEGWQMPQGGVDHLDDYHVLVDGMYKELFEEIGLKKQHVRVLKTSEKVKYDFTNEILLENKKKFQQNYAGQEQIWFYLSFLGTNEDISLINDLHPEFSDWRWVDRSFLIEHIIEMKKEVYKKILLDKVVG